MRAVFVWVGLAALLLGGASAEAHDLWVEPSRFATAPSQSILVRLRVGHRDDVKDLAVPKDRVLRFDVTGPDGEARAIRPLRLQVRRKTTTSTTWSGVIRPRSPGVRVLSYTAQPAYIELAAKKFEAYLEEEGLEAIVRERARRGESDRPGRESYARSCKALVRIGGVREGFDRRVGLPLEVTPLDDPFRVGPDLRFEVLRAGEPLPGAQVDLLDLNGLESVQSARTDDRGVARLRIPRAGTWLVATTTMRRAGADVTGDWESLWATLAFRAD